MTEEEVFAHLAQEVTSYKALPQIWYQMHTKFRDEPRPKSGLLRVREFTMKDAYSLDLDQAGLDTAFDKHHAAYITMFDRMGLPAVPVDASSGAMGGSGSTEFMVPSPAGEDDVVICSNCDYAANIERATSTLPDVTDRDIPELERFPTPGVRTIKALEEIDGGAPAEHQIKTMVMVLDGQVTLALVRGDHQLNLQKLQDATGAIDLRPATPEEAHENLGAMPGSLGAVGVEGLRIVADHSLSGRSGLTTGANEDDWHFTGVSVERDIAVDEWADLREVSAGEACPSAAPRSRSSVASRPAISSSLERNMPKRWATVLDPDGTQHPIVMGSYGIGVERAIATIVETHHDDAGMIWPTSVAPFEAVITIVSVKDDASVAGAEALYAELTQRGVDVIIDDRDARAGVKFADAELIGIPHRVTFGPKAFADGEVEYTPRATGETERVSISTIADLLVETISADR